MLLASLGDNSTFCDTTKIEGRFREFSQEDKQGNETRARDAGNPSSEVDMLLSRSRVMPQIPPREEIAGGKNVRLSAPLGLDNQACGRVTLKASLAARYQTRWRLPETVRKIVPT